MHSYIAIEQGLEQIHYVSLCIWLQQEIARGNLQEEGCCIFKVSSDIYLKIQNGRKSKTKIECKYMIKITKLSKKYNTTETLPANIRK